MDTQLNEIRETIYKENEINKGRKPIKKNQTEILEMKNTVTELKNAMKRLNSWYDYAEKRIIGFTLR